MFIGSCIADTADTTDTTHAAPPMSARILSMLADGFRDIPPVSKVTPNRKEAVDIRKSKISILRQRAKPCATDPFQLKQVVADQVVHHDTELQTATDLLLSPWQQIRMHPWTSMLSTPLIYSDAGICLDKYKHTH